MMEKTKTSEKTIEEVTRAEEVKPNSFVQVSYVERDDSGKVIDTNIEEIAKKEGIHDPEKKYSPKLIIMNEDPILKGLSEALIGMKEGESKEVTIPPEKAYGQKKPENIRTFLTRRFAKQGINLYPGLKIEVGGRMGTVKSIGAGRVRIDFNHPLAGKTIRYYVKVDKVYVEDVDKIKLLFERVFNEFPGEKAVKKKKKTVEIKIPEKLVRDERTLQKKIVLTSLLKKHVPNIGKVVFIEEFSR